MQVVESIPANSSRTIPQGGYFADPALLTDSKYGTPRYGWRQSPEPESTACRYRLVAEASFNRDDESRLSDDFCDIGVDDVDFSIALIDPRVHTSTGTGYRSPYRTFLSNSCWSLSGHSPALEPYSFPLFYDLEDFVEPWHYYDPQTWFDETAFDVFKKVLVDWLLSVIHQQSSKTATSSTLIEFYGAESTAAVENDQPLQIAAQDTHVGAIRWLEEHADLSQGEIADLIDVSRQTVQNWLKGVAIRNENRQRLLGVQEVLQRAQRRGRDGEALKTWLDTPQGIQGQTPRQLLMNNEIGKARALALSTAPLRPRVAPQWLRESPPDSWTQRQKRRRDRFVPEEPHLEIEASDANDE
jgi:DNA-binding transcriptional regulator YiaG